MRRTWLFRLGLTIVGLGIGLTLAELGVRFGGFDPMERVLAMPHASRN